MPMKRLFPGSLLSLLFGALLLIAITYLVFCYVIFPLLIPTEWGGATQ
jgi:hypothetical protein